jgi:hypothetical protein
MRELAVEPALFRTSSFSDELLVHRLRYDALDRGALPVLPETLLRVGGRALVDRLNICDSQDERAHEYSFASRLGDLRLNGSARVADYAGGPRVADAGRAILGFERFTVRAQPGREMLLVLRTAAEVQASVFRAEGAQSLGLELPGAAADVSINGHPLGRATFTARPGWDEMTLPIPAPLVTRERTVIELKGRYAAFHYWLYQ